ncbi:MAG: hypothetical protein Q9M94_00360 [Candidatus Gracilibacteria bacterium]|nr:hypothetical protein [Candidatus Gracilibacteria bacterium]MDQ7021948.1 hypothetical protein [Candidatus Gracilibacteria bacterium]
MLKKIKKIFEKLNYGYWGNKKLFEKKIEILGENFKVINERTYNTSIAFRNTFGTIIGGTSGSMKNISMGNFLGLKINYPSNHSPKQICKNSTKKGGEY